MFYVYIDGAFDNTGFEVILKVLEYRVVEREIMRWISSMLRDRTVEANMCGHKAGLSV